MTSIIKKLLSLPWWVYLAAGNLFFIILTVVFHYLPDFPLKWKLFNPFNLGLEMNIATWWSSILLLALSLIAYELTGTTQKNRLEWLILVILFALLSLDEMGEFHERLGNAAGDIVYLPFILVGGTLLFFVVLRLWKETDTRRTAVLLLIGFALLASAAPQEYLEHRINWPTTLLGVRLGLEEGLELAGMFICFIALIPQRHLTTNDIASLVPNPTKMPYTQKLPWSVIGGQVILIFLVINVFQVEGIYRGNSAMWFPSALFYFLFSLTFWNWLLSSDGDGTPWGLMAILSLFLSIAVLYTLSLGKTSSLNQFGFQSLFPFLALISSPLYILGFVKSRESKNDGSIAWFYLGALAVIFMLLFPTMVPLLYFMAAVYALAMTMLFLNLGKDGERIAPIGNAIK